jgi:hypothetical protein
MLIAHWRQNSSGKENIYSNIFEDVCAEKLPDNVFRGILLHCCAFNPVLKYISVTYMYIVQLCIAVLGSGSICFWASEQKSKKNLDFYYFDFFPLCTLHLSLVIAS